jgi:hypothetical protein
MDVFCNKKILRKMNYQCGKKLSRAMFLHLPRDKKARFEIKARKEKTLKSKKIFKYGNNRNCNIQDL